LREWIPRWAAEPPSGIRSRESTAYGRWTTAGHDYHIELDNTTAQEVCVQVARYPASGLAHSPGSGWSGVVGTFSLTVPAFGAVKTVVPNGSVLGSDSTGALRFNACASPVNTIPAGLHISTYAFDSAASRYLYFFTSRANGGATKNSWWRSMDAE
jgi:hypothetical protein